MSSDTSKRGASAWLGIKSEMALHKEKKHVARIESEMVLALADLFGKTRDGNDNVYQQSANVLPPLVSLPLRSQRFRKNSSL